jgi:SSS family solute:Na+ symporter
MVIGTSIVLVYTIYGGMWSVALTDFVQMIVIGLGLLAIAWFAADLAGGAGKVVEYAAKEGKFQFFPTGDAKEWIFFFAAAITMMLGSIPQQDVFQRVMSSRDAKTAVRGPVIGGVLYFLFALIPMFVVTAAVMVMPETAMALLKDDPQKVLPTLVMEKMPVILQVAFFGALLSAIMSTASATLLAPSTTFVENILRNLKPGMSDQATLRAMRISVLVFTFCVLMYAITMQGTSIYELVSGAYQVPLVGAFTPLVFGLYWKRATPRARCCRWCWVWAPGCCSLQRRRCRRPSPSSWPACWQPSAAWWWAPLRRNSWPTTRGTCITSRAARAPDLRAGAGGGRFENAPAAYN